MPPPLRSLLLAPLLLASGCRTGPSTEAEVLSLIQAQEAAWNAGDVERFVELGYWRSPELTFFSDGTVTRGFEPLVERYRRRYVESGEGMGTLSFTDLEAFELGPEAALARGRWRLDREGSAAASGLFTLVLRRIEGSWRIVHDHTSVAESAE